MVSSHKTIMISDYQAITMPAQSQAVKALTLRLEERDYERLRVLAFVERRSLSDVVREAIRTYLEEHFKPNEVRIAMQRVMAEHVLEETENNA